MQDHHRKFEMISDLASDPHGSSSESIEDSGYERRKSIVHERFKAFIQAKYNQFTPNHDEPYGKPPPTEEWLIDNNLLNH